MSILGIVLVVILIVLLLGGVGGPYVNPNWQHGYGLGWGANGLVVILLIIVIVLLATGRI